MKSAQQFPLWNILLLVYLLRLFHLLQLKSTIDGFTNKNHFYLTGLEGEKPKVKELVLLYVG